MYALLKEIGLSDENAYAIRKELSFGIKSQAAAQRLLISSANNI